jgi:hypothetical protein
LWGPDQLVSSLTSGTSIYITDILVGTYDAKARAGGEYSIYSAYLFDIPITAGNTFNLYAFNSSFTGSLKVVNSTVGATMIGLYVSPSASSTWGLNQLTGPVVPSGSMHLYDVSPGSYDVRVVWDIGPDSYYLGRSVQALTLLTLFAN